MFQDYFNLYTGSRDNADISLKFLLVTGSKLSAFLLPLSSSGLSLEEAVCYWLQGKSRWIQLFLHCWSRIKLHLLLPSSLKINNI